MASEELEFETYEGVTSIDEAAWERVAEGAHPFVQYPFLESLEVTGCVGPGTGWRPSILTARLLSEDEEEGRVVGALPMYVKMHSAGEFVFDWSWADAAARSGIEYYPKAVVQVPFTPVRGRRLLVDAEVDEPDAVRRAMVEEAIDEAERRELSSVHFNFVHPEEVEVLEDLDLPIRESFQYHWYNGRDYGEGASYDGFEDFLGELRSKKRSNVKRQRRRFREAGGSTRVLVGDEVDEAALERMHRYYHRTVHKYFGGSEYLNRDFFVRLGETMGEHLHLVLADRDGEEFGGAFNLVDDDRLYGRYWGALEDVDCAHFEACFYTSIDWCIREGKEVFEGGSGGDHKFDRGFMPTYTHSGHYMVHPALKDAIRRFCDEERQVIEQRADELRADSPYRERSPDG